MKKWLARILKSFAALIVLLIGAFFFFVDYFLFINMIWPVWRTGQFNIEDKLTISNFEFIDNQVYFPITIYLLLGLILAFYSIKIVYKTWRK